MSDRIRTAPAMPGCLRMVRRASSREGLDIGDVSDFSDVGILHHPIPARKAVSLSVRWSAAPARAHSSAMRPSRK